MIQACLFDMGNVLVSFSHEQMLQQMAAVCDCDPEFLREWLFESGRLLDYERGHTSDDELHDQIELAVGKTVNRQELRWAASDIFSQNSQLIPLLKSLRQSGMKLVLLSNTSRIHFEHIQKHFSILEHFDSFVLSYEVGLLKPELEIYKLAVQQAIALPEQCFFTDDIQKNILAARQAGLHAEQYQNVEQLTQELNRLIESE
ncbi:MAG: HAD family phosphatase [Planctomycetaceae bacterium]|nr:HAD family phosphatase [Planctomycetaceae bacterium]